MTLYLLLAGGAAALTGGIIRQGLSLKKKKARTARKRQGGLVVAAVFILLISAVYGLGNIWGILPKDYWSIAGAVAVMVTGGWLDDRFKLKPGWQLFYQALAALLLITVGDTIGHVRLPGWGVVYLPDWLDYGLSFGWIILIINAFNWLDGLDGLAGGVGMIGFLIIFFLALTPLVSQPATAGIAAIMAGALLGFLVFNFFPARVYLGSVGAGLVGLMLAVLSLYSGSKVATTGLVLGIPLLDFFYVSFMRLKEGRKPWAGGDRKHLHYRLKDQGWSEKRTVLLFYALSAGWGLVALTLQTSLKLLALVALVAVFAGIVSHARKKRRRALVLFSGGLDSLLALVMLKKQGLDVTALIFKSPFFEGKTARVLARKYGFKTRVIDFSKKHWVIVKRPRFGYGKNLNPCLDCHLLMLRLAKKIRDQEGYGLIATGEVLGQRSMSQNKDALRLIEKHGELQGQVLRPLSARLLAATIAERQGWVKRAELGAICGKKRTPQLKLAKKYGLSDYQTPAGGCLLTDIQFSQRLRTLLKRQPQSQPTDARLLKYGRVFWLRKNLIIIGRHQEDNDCLKVVWRAEAGAEADIFMELKDFDGPVGLIKQKAGGDLSEAELERIAGTLGWYYPRARSQKTVQVILRDHKREWIIEVKPKKYF